MLKIHLVFFNFGVCQTIEFDKAAVRKQNQLVFAASSMPIFMGNYYHFLKLS